MVLLREQLVFSRALVHQLLTKPVVSVHRMHSRNTAIAVKNAPRQRRSEQVADCRGQRCPRAWWVHGLIVIALLGVCLALYGKTFGLGFLTLDDPDYIQNNPFIANLDGGKLWHIVSTPYFANYAPGHLLSYALDVALAGGKSARAMHLSNVVWYGWVVCMVYVLGLAVYREAQRVAQIGRVKSSVQVSQGQQPTGNSRALSAPHNCAPMLPRHGERVGVKGNSGVGSRTSLTAETVAGGGYTAILMATAAALLFAAHPAHVEVVAWLSSRKDLVATGFAVLSMTCFLRSRSGGSAAKWWLAGSVTSFLLASSGKQSVLLLPLVMLAWDVLVDKRRDWRILAEKVPFVVIALFFGWMTWGAQPSTRQSPDAFVLAMTQWSNLWLLTGLGQYVLYRPKPNPAEVEILLKVAIIAGAGLIWAVPVALARWRQVTRAALCCWVLIQMLPPMALSFLTPITDRYLFLPSVGVCLLLTYLKPRNTLNCPKWMEPLGWLTLAFLLGVWSWKTWDYVGQWRDPRSVWYFAAKKSPSPEAYQYSGEVYHEAADRVGEFIQSGKFANQTNDLSLAAVVLGDAGQLERLRAEWTGTSAARTNSLAYREQLWLLAWDQYEQAVAHRGTLNNPTLFMRRGMILVNRGRYDQAIKEFQIGLELAQTHTYQKVRQELGTALQRAIGVAYWNMGKYSKAKEWLLKAQASQRESAQIWVPTLDQEVERITTLARQQQ